MSKDPKQFWTELRREFKANDQHIPSAESWTTYLEQETRKRKQYGDSIGSLAEELWGAEWFPF